MKFKTKVIAIEAWRWDCGEPMPDWLLKLIATDDVRFIDIEDKRGMMLIRGEWINFHGDDWILLDTEGNPYPCHETVFQKKYERI